VSSLAFRLSWRWQRLRISDIKHSGPFIQKDELSIPQVPSGRLGRSRVGTTLDLYSQFLPGMPEDAAARIDELFQIAEKKRLASGSKAVASAPFPGLTIPPDL